MNGWAATPEKTIFLRKKTLKILVALRLRRCVSSKKNEIVHVTLLKFLWKRKILEPIFRLHENAPKAKKSAERAIDRPVKRVV